MSVLLTALLSFAPPVEVQRPHDEPPALALAWSTADASACPSRDEVIEQIAGQGVAEQIGAWVPERHRQAKLAVEVEVEVVGDRWRASLSLTDADGRSQRSFSAQSCAALADATALIIAVTLDPVAVASMHASVGSTAEPEPERPEPKPEPEPEPKPPEPASEPPPIDLTLSSNDDEVSGWPEDLRVGLSMHGGGGWGPISAFTAAVGGRVSLLGPRWRAELGGRWAIPRRIERNGGAGVFDAWMVEARGCFSPAVRTLEFPLCPGVELGNVRGRGVPPTSEPLQQTFFWAAPTLSQGLSWAPLERFAIGVELGLVAPLTRGRFVVGEITINNLAVVGGRALLHVELRFN